MSEEEVVLRATFDADSAKQTFDDLTKKQEELAEGTDDVTRAQERLNKVAEIAGKALGAYFGAWLSIDFVKRGAEVGDVREGFEKLAESAGTLGDVLLNDLKNATGNTIVEVDLMRKATEQLRAGLRPDEILTVTNAARALAEQVGGELQPELDALTFSLIKGDDRFLKTRGIILDNEKAYAEFAKSIGTTADKLNEQGKAEAVRAATLETLRGKVEELGLVSNDAADNIDSIGTALGNARDRAAEAISNNADLNRVLGDLAKTLNGIDFGVYIAGLSKAVEIGIAAVKETAAAIETIGQFFGDAAGEVAKEYADLTGESKKFKESMESINGSLLFGNAEGAKKKFEALRTEMMQSTGLTLKFGGDMAVLGTQVAQMGQKAGAAVPPVSKLADEIKGTGEASDKAGKPLKGNNDLIKKTGDEAKKTGKEVKTFAEQIKELATKTLDQQKALELLNGQKGLKGTSEQMTALVGGFRTSMIDVGRFTEEIQKLAEEFKKTGGTDDSFIAALTEKLKGMSSDSGVEDAGVSYGESFFNGITKYLSAKE